MRRIERLINLIAALLEARAPMTISDIRTDIAGYDQPTAAAFRRAFERDKSDLRALGIPLETRPLDPLGEEVGYIIPKGSYYLPELDLEDDEVVALRLAATATLGYEDHARAGVLKLAAGADRPWTGLWVAWSADVAARGQQLADLYSALLERRPVSFAYRPAGAGAPGRREVEPYGLVHRRGTWYLVGRDRGRGAIRSFRLGRIDGGVEIVTGAYDIPAGFDAAGYVGREPFEVGPEQPRTATVRFDADLRWWAEQNLPDAPAAEGPGGSVDVELPVANTGALVAWVIGFAGAAEIVAPANARARLVEHLQPWLDDRG